MFDSKESVARLSIISNTLLVLFKIAVGLVIGSVSVLSEAIHSGLDLLAAVMAYFAVKTSGKPPDEKHRYGHGKIENVSGVVEAILIFVAAVWIILEAVKRLAWGGSVETPLWGLLVMGVSGIMNWLVSGRLLHIARKTDSIALEADAWHLRTDVYTSAGVAVGMLFLWITRWQIIDPIIAILVALLILKTSIELTSNAFAPLLDTSLPNDEEQVILEVMERYESQYISFHKLRTRKSGSERHIDLHLVVPWQQSIADSHQLCDQIEADLKERFEGSHVLIHVEPCRGLEDCPGCPERCSRVKEEARRLLGDGSEGCQ